MLDYLWLVHPDEAMCEAFRQRFAGLPGSGSSAAGSRTWSRTTVS